MTDESSTLAVAGVPSIQQSSFDFVSPLFFDTLSGLAGRLDGLRFVL